LSFDRFVNIFGQAADALAHAHNNGVVHRDLKPSNILLCQREGHGDFVKIVDFGIAKIVDNEGVGPQELTRAGDVIGSPLYMSPEQCTGMKLDGRSDIYSLGCVMYFAATGMPACMGANSVQTILKHLNEFPRRPRELRQDLPAEIESLLFRCLQKDPAQRFQSMEELLTELVSVKKQLVWP
jgi:eukaryotic-like serine/threonine-protein kinase